MTAEQKILKARVSLVMSQPFFATLALKQEIREDETCKTAWTDGKTLGYNPAYIDTLTLDYVKSLMAHEVMHIAMLHHTRRGQRDPQLWNEAADHAINNELKQAGFAIMDEWLSDPQYDGLAAEDIYNRLHKKKQEQEQNGNGQQKKDGKQQQPGQAPGEVRDSPGSTPQEMQQAEAKAKVDIQQALNVAKSAGKIPGSVARAIEKAQPAVVDWRDVLQRFVNEQSRSDYTFKKANTRYLSTGFYLPTLHSEKLPPIVVAIDTSGSITQQDLDQFAGEIESIMEMYQTEIKVLYCDTAIAGQQDFEPGDTIKLELHGGGGTSFAPVMQWLNDSEEDHTCLIYFTDMFCRKERHGNEPEAPVLWIATGHYPDRYQPDFGEVVTMY